MRCTGCGLAQLKHSVDPTDLYTRSYGYRSGINATMRAHLEALVDRVSGLTTLKEGSIVIDIGSNDGTLLKRYPSNVTRVGIDPLIDKFKEYYTDDILTNAAFFSRDAVTSVISNLKADIVTSIAMFYDLEDPSRFVADVAALLKHDGLWVVEMTYPQHA